MLYSSLAAPLRTSVIPTPDARGAITRSFPAHFGKFDAIYRKRTPQFGRIPRNITRLRAEFILPTRNGAHRDVITNWTPVHAADDKACDCQRNDGPQCECYAGFYLTVIDRLADDHN